MRILLASLVLLAPFFASLDAQSQASTSQKATPLTLAQAEAIALKNNPQISIEKLNALVAQQYVRETRSALLPNTSLSVTAVAANPGTRIAAGGLNNPILFPAPQLARPWAN